jgi:hypothetical protein
VNANRRILFALLAATIGLLIGCSKSGDEHDSADTLDKHLIRSVSTNGEAVVLLGAEAQKRIDLIVEHPHPAQWQPEVKATVTCWTRHLSRRSCQNSRRPRSLPKRRSANSIA